MQSQYADIYVVLRLVLPPCASLAIIQHMAEIENYMARCRRAGRMAMEHFTKTRKVCQIIWGVLRDGRYNFSHYYCLAHLKIQILLPLAATSPPVITCIMSKRNHICLIGKNIISLYDSDGKHYRSFDRQDDAIAAQTLVEYGFKQKPR